MHYLCEVMWLFPGEFNLLVSCSQLRLAVKLITSSEAIKCSCNSVNKACRLIFPNFPFFLQRYYLQHFLGSCDNARRLPLLPVISQGNSARKSHPQIPDAWSMVCRVLCASGPNSRKKKLLMACLDCSDLKTKDSGIYFDSNLFSSEKDRTQNHH